MNYNFFESNDLFTKISENDLISFLSTYYLTYRDKLNLSNEETFGLEIEFNKFSLKYTEDILYDLYLNEKNYKVKGDFSLIDGAEINTPPLYDTKENWHDLEMLCRSLNGNVFIGSNCGGHIHIGANILGNDIRNWTNFMLLWATYENILYRFSSGEYNVIRTGAERYAKPVAFFYYSDYCYYKDADLSLEALLSLNRHDRHVAVNFSNISSIYLDKNTFKNTIEFRCPCGTVNEVIWQNNVNVFSKMLEYAKSPKFDIDTVYKRCMKNQKYLSRMDLYNKLYIDESLEFCDLIFDNNLDKINFLKQYIKDLNSIKDESFTVRKLTR